MFGDAGNIEVVVEEDNLNAAVCTLSSFVCATCTNFHKPSKATEKNLVSPKR